MQVVKQFSVSCSRHNTLICPVKIKHANNLTSAGGNFLTCAYDPGPFLQIPSPPPWLSSSLTPYPISMFRPIFSILFYCLFVMLRRSMADCSGLQGKQQNEVIINVSPGSRRSKRTSQIFTMGVLKRRHLRVKRGNQTSCAPSSTSNSSPAWRTVGALNAIRTKTKRSEIDSQRRRAASATTKNERG